MGYVQEQQKQLMKEALQSKAELSYQDILDIVYAYQTATGNAIGIGKIKGIIKFLDGGNSLTILKDNQTLTIKNKYQLAEFINSIDSLINLTSSKFFRDCF